MKRVFLQNNSGFSWNSSDRCFVKGWFFDSAGTVYRDEKLMEYFSDVDSFSDFEERVKYANGCFAVVLKKEDELFIAVDKIRSFPLYYSRFEGNWIVSDNPHYIVQKAGLNEKNALAASEFLATGYVTGNETLLEGLRQVQAGEIIHLKKDDLYFRFYYTYRVSNVMDESYQDLRRAGIRVFENAYKRLVDSLGGRTAVIPLSAGYDSRLIAAMLKRGGYEKVICFTYGRKGNREIPISEKVARKLGYPWHYIEYTPELIRGYIGNEIFKGYYRYASGLVSMFFMQEYFAVKYLKENKLIPDDSIFIPGHSGDFLGGSQLNKHGNLSLEEAEDKIVERIFDVKYYLKRPGKAGQLKLKERIRKSLQEKFTGEKSLAYSIQEDWDFKEKLAKFNFNSVTTYCFFGYEFRLPYWDNELLDFFRYLPLSAKVNKFLYDDILC
ncbi:MAG: asparagine synthetase B family protein, partial [Bacteroidales bacterium]|nr:asparagine synthetase B family protein [Bacteroidales bacterium]